MNESTDSHDRPSTAAKASPVGRARLLSPWWFPPGAVLVLLMPWLSMLVPGLAQVALLLVPTYFVVGPAALARTSLPRDRKIIVVSLVIPAVLFGAFIALGLVWLTQGFGAWSGS